jgi:hypothetical protein
MQPKKSHPSQLFEQEMMSAFRIQPDWYEEYWLRPKKGSPSIGGRWRGSNLLLGSILYAAIVSMLIYFGR